MNRQPHIHYWSYPHTIWQGRKYGEVSVARYCKCGAKRIAFASDWQEIPENFPDVRDLCDEEIAKSK